MWANTNNTSGGLLCHSGVHGGANSPLACYLKDRRQYVEVDGGCSGVTKPTAGMPPGSMLGPLLFTIYINDLEMNLSATKTCLYTDDTTVQVTGTSHQEIAMKCGIVNKDIEGWCSANKLKLNFNKTQSIDFTSSNSAE